MRDLVDIFRHNEHNILGFTRYSSGAGGMWETPKSPSLGHLPPQREIYVKCPCGTIYSVDGKTVFVCSVCGKRNKIDDCLDFEFEDKRDMEIKLDQKRKEVGIS